MRRRSAWLAVASAAAAVGLVAGWAWLTAEATLRGYLVTWQFWLLELQFVILAAASVRELPRVITTIGAPSRTWRAVALCVLLGAGLTSVVAPRTSRIFFDEQIYQGIGKSLADSRLAQMCNDGTVEYGRLECWSGEYNKQPYGYPYLLSVAYRLVGTRPWVAHAVNNAAAATLILVVFLTTALAFEDVRAGVIAALVIALTPMQLSWSNTAASEPTAALMCAVAVLAAFQFVRTRSAGALVWTASASIFAASFRPECLLVLPLVAGIVVLLARDELERPRLWWIVAAAVFVGANAIVHLFAVRHENWGASGPRMALDYFQRNLSSNGWFYLGDARFPALFTVLAIMGAAAQRSRRATWALLAYFALFWGVFLLFYAGSYDYGADVRYSLMTYPPVAILAGAGAAFLLRRVGSIGGIRTISAATLLLVFHWSMYLPVVRAVGEEAWAARADVAFAEQAAHRLPPNSIVLTHTPSVFFMRGVNAAQTSVAMTNESRVRDEFFNRYAGGVYLYWNFWCNVDDPAQQVFCTAALDRFDHELIAEQHVRNYRFALYELRARSTPDGR